MIVPLLNGNSNTLGTSRNTPLSGGLAGLFSMLLQSNKESGEPSELQGLIQGLKNTDTSFTEQTSSFFSKLAGDDAHTLLDAVDISTITERMSEIQKVLSSLEAGASDANKDEQIIIHPKSHAENTPSTNVTPLQTSDQASHVEVEALYEELQIEITVIKTKLEAKGFNVANFGDASELAQAFQIMGMSPEEAKLEADRIDAAIKAMKDYLQGKSESPFEGDLGALMTSFSQPSEALSEEVALVQTQISIQQTSLYMKAEYSKSSFASSSILSSPEDMTSKILKGESIADKSTLSPATTKEPEPTQHHSVTARQANPENIDTAKKQLPAEQNISQPQEAASNAEAASDVIHEEDVVLHSDKRSEIHNKKTTTAVDEPLSNITGRKIITARIDNGGVQLEYADAETIDPLIDTTEDGVDMQDKSQRFESALNKSSSNSNPYAQMMQRSNAHGQTSIHMRSLAAQGGGEVKFKLYPEELGEVQIELEVQNGRVRGAISVENPEVAEHLARELHKLQQGLEDAGLSFHEEGVTFLVKDDNPQQGQGEDQQENADGEEDIKLAEATDTSPQTEWVNPDALVDVSV